MSWKKLLRQTRNNEQHNSAPSHIDTIRPSLQSFRPFLWFNRTSGRQRALPKQLLYQDYGQDDTQAKPAPVPMADYIKSLRDYDIIAAKRDEHFLLILIVALDCAFLNRGSDKLAGEPVALSYAVEHCLLIDHALFRNQFRDLVDVGSTIVHRHLERAAAMISGNIDACATWSPGTMTITTAMGDKVVTLATNNDYLDQATFPSSMITTKKYADENRDIR